MKNWSSRSRTIHTSSSSSDWKHFSFGAVCPLDDGLFRKRLSEAVVNGRNERIVRYGMNVIRSSDCQGPGDVNGSSGGSTNPSAQPQLSSQNQPNQGSLLIDATCIPVDIRHTADLSLLNEAREVTEVLIDAMHSQVRESFGLNPRTQRK